MLCIVGVAAHRRSSHRVGVLASQCGRGRLRGVPAHALALCGRGRHHGILALAQAGITGNLQCRRVGDRSHRDGFLGTFAAVQQGGHIVCRFRVQVAHLAVEVLDLRMGIVVPLQSGARGRHGRQLGVAAAGIHRRGCRGRGHRSPYGEAHTLAVALATRRRVVCRGRQRGVTRGVIHHSALRVRLDAVVAVVALVPAHLVAVGTRRARQRNLSGGAQRDVAHRRQTGLRVYRDRHRHRVAVAAVLVSGHIVGGAAIDIVCRI